MIYNESKYNQQWGTKKLSDLGTFERGKSKHRPRNDERLFEGGGYPLIQTGEIKDANLYITHHGQEYGEFGLNQSKLWNAETLCITIAANFAETALLSYPMCFPDSVVGFKAYKDASSEKFMYYVFEYIRRSIQNSVTGSIQDNINIEYLTSLTFKIPSKRIQDTIVSLLSAIDEKILINTKINDCLHQMAYAEYMHMFYGKTPNTKLGNVIIEHPRSSVQVGEAKKQFGNIPFFTSGDAIYRWTESFVSDRSIFLNTGGNADVKFYVGNAAYSTDTWCISGKNNLSDYVYLMLKSIKLELDQKFFQGTGLKHLQKPLLKDRLIYVPTNVELDTFNADIQPWLSMVSDNIRESEELTALRDWLLPMLMNGQVIISD